ncbi:MAG: GlsB/YeaQ/YmgE family stress response membrane protein [Devosiaceae bacterium]|nr:GlsB/YeaQ/YmgE family stress response membrane protein [Devosiaceae bacterium]
MGFIFAILIGGVAGFIASHLMSANNSLILNVVLGVVGAAILNFVFGVFLGLWGGNILWQLLTGIAGASLLIWGYREMQKRR